MNKLRLKGKFTQVISILAAALGAAILMTSWNVSEGPRKKIRQSDYQAALSCLPFQTPIINLGGVFDYLGAKVEVTRSDEVSVGDALYEEYLEADMLFSVPSKLQHVFDRVVLELKYTEGCSYDYKLHYLGDNGEINAYTMGGRVYVTQGMLDFVESDDELACVLSHELFHNELGHINDDLSTFHSSVQLAKGMGFTWEDAVDLGAGANEVEKLLFPAFNHDEELMCDLHGVDLAESAGYDGCAARNFWLRMSQQVASDPLESLLSTHPGAADRSSCIFSHVDRHYDVPCSQ